MSYIFERNVSPNCSAFAGDIKTNNRPDENKHEWPRSRHKCNSETMFNDSSVHNNKDYSNLRQNINLTTTTTQMSNSNLHSTSDIHPRRFETEHISGPDFMFRKISNLFFRRNPNRWQHNFVKWLNSCTKSLPNGGKLMRIEKAMSSLGRTSTIMCLLIFSLLISGPGAAYPVEGGMHIRSITQYVRVLTVSVC